ncbi:MAG: hypothetical protein WD766_01145 [Gemmatimonadota bacterium]
MSCRILYVGVVAFSALLCLPGALGAQQSIVPEWNDARVLELVRTGIERRMTEVVDTSLHDYAASARGYVYFLLDAPELDRQTLVRTDQVAVEMYWRAPDEVRQRIVGLRERRELPVTRLYYYLDRLTVVQDNYGQGIVIADGDNVNDVLHPIAEGAQAHYDYRLADSLTMRLAGLPDPVRVQEVQVRPKNADVPAIVGSVFLEASSGALVRMNFTFTPAAYVDPRLDQISVTLENGLWQGRYWLPYEQRLEIRREIPELDLPFGTVIRTHMRIGDYRFDEGVPDWLFRSNLPITMAPREQREAFVFDEPIDAEWRADGIGRALEVDEIRQEARALLTRQVMSGLPQLRLGFGSASDIFRYNRAEGPALGFGWGLRPAASLNARLIGGYAFGANHPTGSAEIATRSGTEATIAAYVNRPGDVGGFEPAAGVTNSVAALLFGRDWLDPYYASGVTGTARVWERGSWSANGSLRIERQRSAELTTSYSVFDGADAFRPVRAIDAGDHASANLTVRTEVSTLTGDWSAQFGGGGGRRLGGEPLTYARVEAAGALSSSRPNRRASLEASASAGALFGEVPLQELYLIGGRGSLPGYDHRAFGGDRHALLRLTASADIAHPWLRARSFAGLGWTGASAHGTAALAEWGAVTSPGIKPALGLGLGVFYDLIHLDLVRGVGDEARTQLIVEIQRPFWDFL